MWKFGFFYGLTNLRPSTADLADITVMKLRLFRWWLWLHHGLFLLPGSNLVLPSLPLWRLWMMLLLNKGRCGIVNSCFISLWLIICSISSRGTAITRRVIGACLPISGCLSTSVGIRVCDSRRLRRVRLSRMCFRNHRRGTYRSRINTCPRRWISCFSCPSGVLSVISTLSGLHIRRRLL